MAKPISLNKFVGCDENNGNPTNPFNPDEDEFGDCLFNPDSDLKNNVSKKRNTIIVSPVKPVKRKKNEDSPVNHKKIESSPKIAPITKLPSKDMKIEPKIVAKPPLPPKPSIVAAGQKIQKSFSTPGSTPKMKRKVEEANNATLVQKLSAQSEQLRLEISLLKTALSQEKNAVRALRAQNEAESRRLKQDIKRLQDTIQNQKTSSLKKGLAPAPAKGNTETHQAEIARLNHEIVTLREAFKNLDDKYQSSLKAENQKLAELKDSYEQRLTQTSLSAKTEIQRLLEELKSKEHLLTQARDELSFNHKQREEETQHNEARFSQKMRKINEFEHINGDDDDIIDDHLLFDEESFSSSNSLTNGTKSQQTTCGMASLHETEDIEAQPHESPNNSFKETKININMANNKDLTRETSVSSDLDSALSSAPQSLSPQPQTCPNSPVVWPKERDKRIQEENEEITELLAELECARQQIKTLEEELTELKNKDPSKKLKERCRKLEHQEAALTKELHEVREQNELLEFRIIELEEAHDKWSVRSNSTPSGTTKDVWTDTEKESEDIVMSERSDSGVTSPNNSHHHSEDQHSVSPCDLSLLDQLPTEEIRKRIREMSKRNCYDEDDKTCLMQVLSLLNNLEALSKDHDTISTRSSQSCTDDENTYKPSESETHHLRTLSLVTASPFKSQSGKIIATVQPFSSSNEDLYRSRSELPSAVQKKKSWINTCLQESGVFEGDPADFCTATTQTEPEDFPEKTNAELCAEIEKLNKFREKIEEFSTKKLPLLPPTEIERRLQYYRERVAVLENKVLVYESTGDTQTKHLADRLQREIQLESIVKQYSDKIAKLTRDFRRVEDERNELEEIENDTRLANQRIEEELEVMSQRNVELEISKDTYMEKYHEAKENVACLEECLQKCEERIFVLEEHENDLKHQLETITQFIPLVGVYCAWKGRESAMPTIAPLAPPMPAEVPQTVIQTIVEKCSCDSVTEKLQTRINELLAREKDLLQNISELNRAYNETLENADNLWAQMERDYKEKIFKYEEGEMNLKSKLAQLEDRLKHDSAYAQERITHLEESETAMKERISKLIKENKEILAKNAALLEECRHIKEEYTKLRQYVDGPAAEALEKEKRKIKVLEDELLMTTKMLKHTEEVHQDELSLLKTQLKSANKELTHTEVTNSELKEEVETLEAKIKELGSQRAMYEDKIKYLTEELKHKEKAVKPPFLTERTLAQELARPIRRGYSSDSSDSSKRSTEFLDRIEEARPHREFRSVADTIIMNAETRACRATKRSFVEEVSCVPLRLRGGNDEPRRSISQVLENIQITDSEINASLEVLDDSNPNLDLQIVIDLNLEDGNIQFVSENPLATNDNLQAVVVAKQTADGFQTQIEFSNPGTFDVESIEFESPVKEINENEEISSGTQSICAMGMSSNLTPIAPQKKIESELTTDLANLRLSEHETSYHRVIASQCEEVTDTDKEDILLETLKHEISALKEKLGIDPMDDESPESLENSNNKETNNNKPSSSELPPKSPSPKTDTPTSPVQILCVHAHPPDLLVHWKPTMSLPVSGYEIDIDGVPAAKTYSAIRTAAFLYDVDVTRNHLITIYAMPCPDDFEPDPVFYMPGCFRYQPNGKDECFWQPDDDGCNE